MRSQLPHWKLKTDIGYLTFSRQMLNTRADSAESASRLLPLDHWWQLLLPLAAEGTELNPQETVWQYLNGNLALQPRDRFSTKYRQSLL
jgi:hypothetical protein